MDYNEKRRKALLLIDEMYYKGNSENEINYKVGLLYGFGELIVKKRLLVLEALRDEHDRTALKKVKENHEVNDNGRTETNSNLE